MTKKNSCNYLAKKKNRSTYEMLGRTKEIWVGRSDRVYWAFPPKPKPKKFALVYVSFWATH